MSHVWIGGMTQSGKTTYALMEAERLQQPVLFFDTKLDHAKSTPGWVHLDGSYTWREIARELSGVGKVRYLPHAASLREELTVIVDNLLADARAGKRRTIIIDEIALLATNNQASGPCQTVAIQGLGLGVTALFISQSAADSSKTVLKQCDRVVLFRMSEIWEGPYWDRLPDDAYEQIKRIWQEPYAYAIIENDTITRGKEVL